MDVISIVGVSKSYDAVHALKNVTFSVKRGEIHVLVGENGAGKSTLVKIITGIEHPDSGSIVFDGREIRINDPMHARSMGITAVYQDPKLFPQLDIAENIFIGIYPKTPFGTVDRRSMYEQAKGLLSSLGVELDPRALIAGLSVAELQFVEIARAISSSARLLILDEPTASLTPAEAGTLFRIVRELREGGTSVIFISHRMEEIFDLADAITVLRDGECVVSLPASELDEQRVIQHMVGRPLNALFARKSHEVRPQVRLRVEGLSLDGVFSQVSFEVHAGEILGMAGLVGAGRSEIAQSVFGILGRSSGRVFLDDAEIEATGPHTMLQHGVAYLPEDRDTQGLITTFSVSRNMSLAILRKLSPGGILRKRSESALARRYIGELSVKTKDAEQRVSSLSGGNRQKVVLAKWLATEPKVLILDEPTHGIDIGAKVQVHQNITELADRGFAILLISSDLPEILAISDRIVVIAEGRLVAEFNGADATQEEVMRAASMSNRNGDE